MLEGDIDTGKIALHDYIDSTLGLAALGKALGRDPKTLMRMLGPQRNPTIRNFFEIVAYLQQLEGLTSDALHKKAA